VLRNQNKDSAKRSESARKGEETKRKQKQELFEIIIQIYNLKSLVQLQQ
jgi:hypothetical protein